MVELILFLMPDVLNTHSKSRGELLWPQIKTSKMAYLNEVDISKLIQQKNILLLLHNFSSFSNSATSTPAGKEHQMIMYQKTWWMKLFWRLALTSQDFANKEAHTELLCVCVCVATVWVQTLVACICHSACADTWCRCLLLYLEVEAELLPVCNGPYEVKDPMSTFHIKIFKTVAHG